MKSLSRLFIVALAATASCYDGPTVVDVASSLKFDSTIPNVAANAPIPTFTISLRNALGAPITNATAEVTITAMRNDQVMPLAGTAVRTTVNGVATFSGLSLSTAGTGYALIAGNPSLTAASSNQFSVTP